MTRFTITISFLATLLFSACEQGGKIQPRQEGEVYLDSMNELAFTTMKTDIDSSLELSQESEVLCHTKGYTLGEARAISIQATVHKKKSAYDTAIYLFRRALDMRRDEADQIAVGKSYNNISECYRAMKDYDKGLKFADSAYQIYSKFSEYNLMSGAASNMAVNYVKMGLEDSAKLWFRKSVSFAERDSNSDKKLSNAYYNYSSFLRRIGEKDSGIYFLRKSLEIAVSKNHKSDMPGLYLSLGQYYVEDDPELSLRLYDTAFSLAEDIGLLDKEEKVLKSKAHLLRDLGYPLSEVSNTYDSLVRMLESHSKTRLIEEFSKQEVRYKTAEIEAKKKRLEQQSAHDKVVKRWFVAIIFLLILISFLVIRGLVQQRKLAEKEKELSEKKIDAVLARQEMKKIDDLLEFQENERNRIASDLHDRLGSLLGAVKLNFSSMEAEIKRIEQKNSDQYEMVKGLIDEAATEVRKIAHDMASGVLTKFGLVPAVYDLKKVLEASGKITINIHEFGMDERLSSNQEIMVYRIIQELISNSLKHAKAKNIDVHFTKSEDMFTVMVEDDGVGFEQLDDARKGIGLKNIEKRAAELGGIFTIDSSPRSGTTAIFELALNDE